MKVCVWGGGGRLLRTIRNSFVVVILHTVAKLVDVNRITVPTAIDKSFFEFEQKLGM